MTKRGKTNRGRKSNLPPRVPAVRRIPRLEHIDFASPAVISALKAAGWKAAKHPVLNEIDPGWNQAAEVLIQEAVARGIIAGPANVKLIWPKPLTNDDGIDEIEKLALHNDIRALAADYIANKQYQMGPKNFRTKVKTFHKALKALVESLPRADDELSEALNCELDKLTDGDLAEAMNCRLNEVDSESAQDLDHIRGGICALLKAAERILADEAGRGTDADRSKHCFLVGLARIFEERTGRKPTRNDESGDFFAFVAAVDEQMPADFRLTGIDHLIRSYLEQQRG
jgi:hypothetical protein